MDIIYTDHAEDQLRERRLERVWVEETIRFPDVTEKDGVKHYVTKKLNGFTLRVVYVKETNIKVITMYWI